MLGGQDLEGVRLGLPNDNPELGLDCVLSLGVGAEGLGVEIGWVLMCRSIRVSAFTKPIGVLLDFRPGFIDDGLDLAQLRVAQTELFRQSRQHALEEAQPIAALVAGKPTVTAAVGPLAGPPGSAGSTSVSGTRSCLGEDRRRCSEDNGRCYCEDDVSVLSCLPPCGAAVAACSVVIETTATPSLLTILRKETHQLRKERSRVKTGW